MAIEGRGFFVVHDGLQQQYTRDGSFNRDSSGYLVNSDGYRLMGWSWDEETGGIDTAQPLGGIHIPLGEEMIATGSSRMGFSGNLNAAIEGTVSNLFLEEASGLTGLNASGLFFGDYALNTDDLAADPGYRTELIASYTDADSHLENFEDSTTLSEVAHLISVKEKDDDTMTIEITEINKITGEREVYTRVLEEDGGTFSFDGGDNAVGEVTYHGNFTIDDDVNVGDKFLLDFSRDQQGPEITFAAESGAVAGQELVYRRSEFADGEELHTVFLNEDNGKVNFGSFTIDMEDEDAFDTAVDAATFSYASSSYTYDTYVFDSQGARHFLDVSFVKVGDNRWEYTVNHQDGLDITDGTGTLVFASNGRLDEDASDIPQFTFNPGTGADVVTTTPDLSPVTQLASPSNVIVREQDGFSAGELIGFNVEQTGVISGVYSNGEVRGLGQVALAYFVNPEGLAKQGGNLYDVTSNSGDARIGTPGSDGRGLIQSEALEMSNVDLSFEFTEMITTSRAFQANTRVITTSDEVLMEVVNLKR